MYYADPDGNQMEFQVDSFGSNNEANAFMAGPLRPIRSASEYDPDEWLVELRAGTPASKVLRRQTDEPISRIRGALAR